MSSGVFKDPWVQCNKCSQRRFWSEFDLGRNTAQDGTVAALRKILKRRGWQVAIPDRTETEDEGIISGPRQDLCPAHRTTEGKGRN